MVSGNDRGAGGAGQLASRSHDVRCDGVHRRIGSGVGREQLRIIGQPVAVGGDETLDPELVDLCFTELQKSAEDWRSAGAFGPEKTASDASTQARLLALSGR